MPTSSTLRLGQRLLLGLLLLLLLGPALQAWHPLLAVKPLDGVTDKQPQARFSWAKLWDGRFQAAFEDSLTEYLGFRPWLVRVRNQVAYSLWHKSLTEGIIIGHDQELYQQSSVEAYLGGGYLGDGPIAEYARQLRLVQDSLRAHGTQFLFVIAPSKARILPRGLPAPYDKFPGVSNYATFSEQFAKNGVNTLDAAALFLRWQAAGAPYPLYARTGTHWSGYGTARLADTLFHRIENLTGRNLPDFGQQGPPTVVTEADSVRFADKDLGDLLNLVREIPPRPLAYPHVVFHPAPGQQRLNAIVIGDSFTKSFYTFYPYFDQLLAPEARLWYYNNTVYWPEHTPPGENRNVRELNLAEQLRGRQLVLIVALEANLQNPGFDFIKQAYSLYTTPHPPVR